MSELAERKGFELTVSIALLSALVLVAYRDFTVGMRNPYWDRIVGFDHGKTNPTAALVTAVDCDGRIYCLSEYYNLA